MFGHKHASGGRQLSQKESQPPKERYHMREEEVISYVESVKTQTPDFIVKAHRVAESIHQDENCFSLIKRLLDHYAHHYDEHQEHPQCPPNHNDILMNFINHAKKLAKEISLDRFDQIQLDYSISNVKNKIKYKKALHSRKKQGLDYIRHQAPLLSCVSDVFYDYDDTLYYNKKIDPFIVRLMKILHEELGVTAHLITARNKDHQHLNSYYFRNPTTLAIEKIKAGINLPSMLNQYGLSTIFPEENIIYCNFFDKILLVPDFSQGLDSPVDLTSEKNTYYYDYTSNSKNKKIPDFEVYCLSRNIQKDKVLILDDREDVWLEKSPISEVLEPIAPLLQVDNSSPKLNLKRHLTQILTQCILYGEHIPLDRRQSAAHSYLTLSEQGWLSQKSVFDLKLFLENTARANTVMRHRIG